MSRLENPPENPCFGCGPNHPRGLRLTFARERAPDGVEEIRVPFVPRDDEIGWPGLFHTGLHFLVLYEASYWAALEFGGRLMVSTGPGTYAHVRLPRTGRPHLARARWGEAGPLGQAIVATSETEGGRPCGTLTTYWRPVEREEIERAQLKLPAYLWEAVPPGAAAPASR